VALVAVFDAAASGAGPNISGNWEATFDCTSGPCKAPSTAESITFVQASGSTTVTGSVSNGDSVSGTLSGTSLSVTASGANGGTVHTTATVAANGRSFSGTYTDSKGSAGTVTAVLESGGAPTTPAAVAAVVSGSVSVEVQGSSSFKRLTGSQSIPVGATVNATHGTVRLTSPQSKSGAETGLFYAGEFKIDPPRDGVTELTLAGGVACASPAKAATPHRPLMKRQLWGDAHAKFTTTGQTAAATVLGTKWEVIDTCSGTTVHVATGEVRVTNLITNQTLLLFAPHSYVAKA
jgi:hypothetical protein